MPHFIIIGAQKSGTTSLFHYLNQHPAIRRASRKEVHFFDGGLDSQVDNYAKGPGWYRAHFPRTRQLGIQAKTFEASPLYLFNPLVPKRIHALLPQVKIIAILRNPTERAISHYFHEQRSGREPLPIKEALAEEEARLGPSLRDEDYQNQSFIHHSYKSRGRYQEQLVRFQEYFPPAQMLILSSEELFHQPQFTLRKIFSFVGVEPAVEIKKLQPQNPGTNQVGVDRKVVESLDDYFGPYNQALDELVGRTFAWGKKN